MIDMTVLKDDLRYNLELIKREIGAEKAINLCSDILGYTHDNETLLERRNRLGELSAKQNMRD